MKTKTKFLISALCITLALTGVVIAKRVVTNTGAAVGTIMACGLPGDSNSYPVVYAIGFDAVLATSDLTVYQKDDGVITLTKAKVAGMTTLKFTGGASFDDDDYIVLQNASGTTFEVIKASDIHAASATITALTGAYSVGDKGYEMKVLATWADVGTSQVNIDNSAGIFGGSLGSPLAVTITGGVINYITMGYQ
jgi:hypothetical protein